ncbi:MAG TPA: IS5 family transposase [Sphingobium sp.]|uniref:IS5 family transposase n=1 Tax=Sphingobium sp. TaxID=1912891 RepID=UPI000EE9FCD1|nr:IS5 family transposase [Sphingobium sp.]HAF43349.1 IS5 family transposase [Sphingobium sp.]
MSRSLFWLSDGAWAVIEPHLPKNQPGARRVDDRRVISGIIHMLKCGGRWADCPSEYGPSTTVYNRWNRWSRRGIWTRILAALTEEGWITETGQIDSSYIKAHRSAGGAKGGPRANAIGISRGGRTTKIHALVDVLGRPLRLVLTPGNTSDVKGADMLIGETIGMKRVIADRGYDANRIRAALREQGTIPVIPGRRNRKRPIQYDERRYKDRWRVEAMFCRLKDFRRIATRYDKLARNFLSAVSLAAAVAFWL